MIRDWVLVLFVFKVVSIVVDDQRHPSVPIQTRRKRPLFFPLQRKKSTEKY
jgi:hypothetical protein